MTPVGSLGRRRAPVAAAVDARFRTVQSVPPTVMPAHGLKQMILRPFLAHWCALCPPDYNEYAVILVHGRYRGR